MVIGEEMKKLRIHWYCPPGTGLAVFNDSYPENQGVGGAEASVIYLTRAWAAMGHEVTVYGEIPEPMVGHGVKYEHAEMFSPTDDRDVFILHRTPAFKYIIERVNADVKLFFSCDQGTVGKWSDSIYPFIDKIIAISPYHAQYLYLYQNAKKKNIYVTDLGVTVSDYTKKVKKIKNKMIFCSVPERGLTYAIDYFRVLRQRIPDATLVVTSDHRLWGASYTGVSPVLLSVAQNTEGIEYLGKIDRKELIRHQLESEIMFYPCCYDENFCISAAECQMAGAVPVTTRIGAMSTTVRNGETGIVHDLTPFDPALAPMFIDSVVDLLNDEVRMNTLREQGIKRATNELDWNVIASKWLELFDTIKGSKHGL